jgi:protein rlx
MPLFKCSASKAKPKNGIAYVTDEKKAKIVTVRNLFEDEDYAKQFEETASRFGKGDKFDERKYYHCKLSCARQDNVSPEKAHAYAEELVAKLFQNYECVIATHTDTQTVHSHIIVNAVDPIMGKKLQFNKQDYVKMKDEANRLGKKYGFTETDFRKRGKNSRTAVEKKIMLKGGTSWKEELREVIAEAIKNVATSDKFKEYLEKCYGVKITRDGKDYSYLHPNKQKPIRGERLGTNYTKSEVIKRIGEQNNGVKSGTYNGRCGFNGKRTGSGTVRRSKAAYGGNAGSIIRASLSGIEREMQRLNFAAECAGGGLDAASEERRMDERRARDEAERRRRAADERYERGQSELAVEPADNASKDNGNGNGNTTANKYNYGKGD